MDFVDFNLAKKLKEKGFKYNKNNLLDRLCMENQINHPSIHQVLKWLRKKHLLVIPVPSYFNADGICTSWDCDIWADDNYENFRTDKETYEEAAIAGIEYCLDNLI